MATCSVEGIDPVRMCRNLLDRVEESNQLQSEADPGLLLMFQDWLEKLEQEAFEFVNKTGSKSPSELADKLGISESGSIFLLKRLIKKGGL